MHDDGTAQTQVQTNPLILHSSFHDISPNLRDIPAVPVASRDADEAPDKLGRVPHSPGFYAAASEDPVLQNVAIINTAPNALLSLDGLGQGFTGPGGAFTVQSAPPDTDGDVGPNHYVQIVNSSFAIFNKSGAVVFGPAQTNTLWQGLGGACATTNDGDGTVRYDRLADRWVISQFSVNGGSGPFFQCIAVSTTPDPTGSYARYAFQYTAFNDYPKMGLWPDGYYFTYNMFPNNAFAGAKACAMDRARMLTGAAATMQCFDTGASFGGLLASDVDGPTPPPAGSPNFMVALGTNNLGFWKFHVDWATPANSTFTGPLNIAVANFTALCGGGGTCVVQPGTTQQLDSLSDRLMNRFAYRNFGDHESLLVSHAVTAGSGGGVRWYELRSPNATPTVFQQGTYAPDNNFRWISSLAMDASGNIGMGFSVSGSSVNPSVRYTGRLAGDALGTMGQGEGVFIAGGGAQSGQTLSRWGDYSSMNVDPSDDCTFWYTQEYIATTGVFNWHTRIGSFKFPGCGGTPPPPGNDFSITASPGSLAGSGSSSISTAVASGSAATVNLTVSGAPSGASASLNPTSVTAGGSSTLTVNAGSAAAGTYTLTVTGTEGTATHATTVTLTVGSPPPPPPPSALVNGGFETGNTTGWTSTGTTAAVSGGHSGSFAAQVGATGPSTDSSLSQTFTAGASDTSLSFFFKVVCPDTVQFDFASATLKDNTAGTTATVLANTCSNTGAWVKATAAVTGGHSYTLTLSNHDDNFAGDPTFTLYDDVALSGGTPPPPPPPPSGGITNGGFESGSFTGWSVTGTTSIVGGAHGGSSAAQAGSSSITNGDSSISQSFTAPAGTSQMSAWYNNTCTDTVQFDWATITLKDNTAGSTSTVLPKTCTTAAWNNVTASVTAGHSYTVTLTNHDDNNPGDPTFTLFDDVTLN